MFSTVNVQHLESLNDQVAELTGIRVRETVPDAVVGAADEVVLIDITPQSLIERLVAGKVYPAERVRPRSTTSSRSRTSPRCARSRSGRSPRRSRPSGSRSTAAGRPGDERLVDTAAPAAVGERLLALVKPHPRSQRVVRRAWRSAQRLGAELDVLWVADHEPNAEEQEQLDALRRLSSVLGAHLLVEHGDDIAAVAQRVAQDRGTTYVLIGTPEPRGALRRLTKPALPDRLLALLPGVDLRIVADRTKRVKGDST